MDTASISTDARSGAILVCVSPSVSVTVTELPEVYRFEQWIRPDWPAYLKPGAL